MKRAYHFTRPSQDELLSSWLRRVAINLGFTNTRPLLKALDWPVCTNLEVDFACPPDLQAKIARNTTAGLHTIKRNSTTSYVRLPSPERPSFKAEMVGYVWGQSTKDILNQVRLISKSGCESLIVKKPSSVIYSQFQRELAFTYMMKSPAGTTFVFSHYSALAWNPETLAERLDEAVKKGIRVHFARSGVTFSAPEEVSVFYRVLEFLETTRKRSPLSGRKRNPSHAKAGRKSALTNEDHRDAKSLFLSGKATAYDLSLHYGISLATMYRYLGRDAVASGPIPDLPSIESSNRKKKMGGRKPILSAEQVDLVRALYASRELSPRQLQAKFGISSASLYRYLDKANASR